MSVSVRVYVCVLDTSVVVLTYSFLSLDCFF